VFSRIIYVVHSAKPDHMDVTPRWAQNSGLTVLMDLKFRVSLAANILTLSRTRLVSSWGCFVSSDTLFDFNHWGLCRVL